ncbi:ATP-binding protein [Flavobacterium pectinovorum]|uniref:tetratricopeptide repeat-containing sensor histidine kinase n=1 Tax=Flavobacterium pectinovorum TaxID=29533 RepID=UPI00265DFFE0|nr:ATP-binding protein [Flavobacterium pectinovorum]WKL48623.1 ATP-binding protein [Flavobacterium pectinovorum]
MLRSPFFCFILFIFFLSCKEKTTVEIQPNSLKKEAMFLQEKAMANFQKSNFNSSFYYFNKSKIAFETSKDSANIVFNLTQMANIQQINGDYYGSKETLTEALPYTNKNNDYGAAISNLFGIADKELSLYDDAVFYYKQAINDVKDEILKQSPLNNIAVVYIKQKKYDKAIEILESILKSGNLNASKFVKNKARVIDNLGFAYFKNGNPDKGLQLMNESLKLRNNAEDFYGSIESYLHLAEFYAKTNSKKSNQNAQNAYQIATKFHSIDERLKALSLLISNGSGTQYAQKYISLNDSIIKIRNNFKNKFAKIKYDSKKEKDENQKLKLEKVENLLALQEAKYQKIVGFIGFIFLGIVIVVLVRYYKNKNRIIRIKTAYDTETRIAKDIHDELANDVFNAITFTQTQSLSVENTKETLIQKLDHIYTRVRGISRENNDIETGTNYSDNLKEMLSTYNSKSTNVIINNIEKVIWNEIDEIKKVTIYRVLQELMVNMKKHSHAPLVALTFDSDQKYVFINYVDRGKGAEKNKIVKNGLQNMENRILAIKGTITFDTEPDKGFRVNIKLPK